MLATGSMDTTAKLWDVEKGSEITTLRVKPLLSAGPSPQPYRPSFPPLLQGHTAEIVSLNFNQAGSQIITGSFDHTVKVWDVRSGK